MPQTVLEVVTIKNAEDIKIREYDLSLGKAKDFADYRYQCGIMRGLTLANVTIKELSQAALEDDDDE